MRDYIDRSKYTLCDNRFSRQPNQSNENKVMIREWMKCRSNTKRERMKRVQKKLKSQELLWWSNTAWI